MRVLVKYLTFSFYEFFTVGFISISRYDIEHIYWSRGKCDMSRKQRTQLAYVISMIKYDLFENMVCVSFGNAIVM